MDYNMNNLVPYIPASEYDTVAEEFLNEFYADALKQPMAVPIERYGIGCTVCVFI